MNEPEKRNYPNTKVYYDGSHYIAIPQDSFPRGKSCKRRHTAYLTPEQIEQKQAVENAYTESKELPYEQRAAFLDEQLKTAIPNDTKRKNFIAENKDRKRRNRSKRYSLLWRKVRLQQHWNWFITFTFSDDLHTEESFRKTLKDTLKKLVQRHG